MGGTLRQQVEVETAGHGATPGRAGTERAWVGIVANMGCASGRRRQLVERLVAALAEHGLAGRVAWTPEERAAIVAAAGAEPGCRALVAAGGDGTVAALINERPRVPIAVLPAGTENLFARHVHADKRPEALARRIAEAQARRIDLGRADGRLFHLMAGFGFDAEIVGRHHRARLGRCGRPGPSNRAAYVEPILSASLAYRFPTVSIRVEDPGPPLTLEGTSALIFNLPRYALGLPFAPSARDDDGLLDLIVFQRPGPLSALRYLWLVLRRLHLRRRGVFHRVVRRAVLTAGEPVPVQLDGDPGGVLGPSAPWTVEVVPGALEVLAPPRAGRG
jgi:diacylglycerol kinase (ATP)